MTAPQHIGVDVAAIMGRLAEARRAHTPGPWRLGRTLIEHHRNGTIQTPRGNIVLGWDSTASIPAAEHNANARLIAAAPDMLEALQRIVALKGSTGGPAALVREFHHIARAAIAAATQAPGA